MRLNQREYSRYGFGDAVPEDKGGEDDASGGEWTAKIRFCRQVGAPVPRPPPAPRPPPLFIKTGIPIKKPRRVINVPRSRKTRSDPAPGRIERDTSRFWREAPGPAPCRYVEVRMHARKCVSRVGAYASRAARDTLRARVAARSRSAASASIRSRAR